jgi:hypothetical protein
MRNEGAPDIVSLIRAICGEQLQMNAFFAYSWVIGYRRLIPAMKAIDGCAEPI